MKQKSNTLKKQILLLAIIIPLLLLTGCTSEEQQQNEKYLKQFLGTWTYFDGGQLTFTEDFKVSIQDVPRLQTMNIEGTYNIQINQGELILTNSTDTITFQYSFSPNTLKLTDESGGTFTFDKI